jgi:hypothetical protein
MLTILLADHCRSLHAGSVWRWYDILSMNKKIFELFLARHYPERRNSTNDWLKLRTLVDKVGLYIASVLTGKMFNEIDEHAKVYVIIHYINIDRMKSFWLELSSCRKA